MMIRTEFITYCKFLHVTQTFELHDNLRLWTVLTQFIYDQEKTSQTPKSIYFSFELSILSPSQPEIE